MSSPPKQHPVLTEELIQNDGARRFESRVFCDVRGQSVPLDLCRDCPFCIAVEDRDDRDSNWVHCSPPAELVAAGPSAGAALRRGAVVVDETVLVRDVVALFVEKGARMLVVADATGRAQGVVHESRLLREIQAAAHRHQQAMCLGWEAAAAEPASSVTSTTVTVLESLPLREAVMRMATAHQRQVVVVDERGYPVGLLLDVDALHGLRAKPPDDEES